MVTGQYSMLYFAPIFHLSLHCPHLLHIQPSEIFSLIDLPYEI